MKFWLLLIALLAFPVIAAAQTQTATFKLTWTDNSNTPETEEDKTEIERKLGATGTYAKVGEVGRNITEYIDTITGAGSLATYFYRVRAVNTAGASGYSNEASGVTPVIKRAPNTPTLLDVNP